jgi:hypothetical protein
MLGADTRTTYKQYLENGNTEDTFTDGACKIIETNIGYLSGAGYVDLLDCVNDRIKKEKINDINDINKIILEEKQILYIKNNSCDKLKKHIKETGWIATYKNLKGDIESSYYCIENCCFEKIIGEIFVLGAKNEKYTLINYVDQERFSAAKKIELQGLDKSLKNSEIWTKMKIIGDSKIRKDVSENFYIAIHFKDETKQLILFNENEP